MEYSVSAAFGTIGTTTTTTTTRRATFLKYTVIAGLDEEEQEEAKNPEARELMKKAGKSDGGAGPASLAGYRDYDELDGENELNVDSFNNPAGGIMPGYNLSGLCGDD